MVNVQVVMNNIDENFIDICRKRIEQKLLVRDKEDFDSSLYV